MFDDEDYSFFTGGIGDVNDDGIVDEVEYLMEEEEYFQIMEGKKDDDFVLDNDDDDWEMLYSDTAAGYGLSPYDYADKEEFLEALQLAKESDEDADFDEENEGVDIDLSGLPEDFDFSKLSLTIGATTSLNYDGVPIDQVFGAKKQLKSTVRSTDTTEKSIQEQSIERKYYDREDRKYRIGDAIYDNFKEVSDNYEREECESFSELICKIYNVDKELGVTIWVWAIYNFPGALVNRGVDKWDSQAWCLTDMIFGDLAGTDADEDEENTFIFDYVSKNPDLEDIIFNKTYVEEQLFSLTKYVPYCIENNLRDNFLRVYNGIMTNPFRDEKKMSKYSIVENLLTFCNIEGVEEADPWFYAFFEKEIKALNKPLKEAYLMKKLNDERYGKKIFLKPEKENLELDDEYFGESDKPHEISAEEYKKLKNENKALKSKVTKLENQITDLNYNIRRLEADLEAARKAKVKEWDGKYYRYCRVTLDECPGGLWYRTDDITLKKGDYVYVPYGKENEELMAKVVSVEEFRSDDLPFPLQRTKFIIEKCDA